MTNDINKRLDNIERELISTQESLKDINILIRVNNLLLSRFILQLTRVRRELGLPKRVTFFKFEILEEDYNQLISEYSKTEVDKALYRLDRLLLQNKQQCPNNIRKYILNKLKKSSKRNKNHEQEEWQNTI